ncbi:MAG TPA: M4 family metallopeptidase [Candidatus Acidoferrum sp.]|nr:M4 family metallopeptidase [Candidatus Acidoferrum sp.]
MAPPVAGADAAAEMSGDQANVAQLAERAGVAVTWEPRLGTPLSIRGANLGRQKSFSSGKSRAVPGAGNYEANAIAVMDNLARFYRLQDAAQEFAAAPPEADSLGDHHVRLAQRYRGLPVFGGDVIVHFGKDDEVYEVNGRYVPDIQVDVVPGLDAASVGRIAQQDLLALGKPAGTLSQNPQLMIFARDAQPQLAYALMLVYEDPSAGRGRWRYWIDARQGQVLLRYNDVQQISPPTSNGGAATVTGSILAGEGGQSVSVTGWYENTGYYYLHSTNRAWYAYNRATNGYPDNNTYAYRSTANWDTSDRVEMSGARNFDLVQRYYQEVHGRDSFDNARAYLQANLHYGTSYVNAYWDGAAIWIGDGDGVTANSLAVLDVCGHEYTHAVDQYTAGLVYSGESGALNESFSDIFGTCIEFWAEPDGRANYPAKVAGTADWLCGEDSWLSSVALRDLRNPGNLATVGAGNQQPSRYQGTYWDPAQEVHRNSGVQNFFFYLLSEGGSGNNDGLPYSVAGIGVSNAEQVAYRALTVYCTPGTDYRAARSAWLSAALDLNTDWAGNVGAAWSAVGVSALYVAPVDGVSFRGPVGGPFSPPSQSITLMNRGGGSMNWSVTLPPGWVNVTPTNGVIPVNGSNSLSMSLNASANGLAMGIYTNYLTLTNSLDTAAQAVSVKLLVGQPDYFTECFDAADNDLDFQSFTFIPDGSSSYYSLCRETATNLATNPSGGNSVTMSDDTSVAVTLAGTNTVAIYNRRTNVFYIGSNGYLTLDSGDTTFTESLAAHFNRPRISALFDDLYPTTGQVTWKQLSDRVAVTYLGVPLFGSSLATNTFQIELFYDGRIRVTYLAVSDTCGLAGLSAGSGVPVGFVESDLTSYSICWHDDLVASPDAGFAVQGPPGGPFVPAATDYTLGNAGTNLLNWAALATQPWLTAGPSGGSLAPGAFTNVTAQINGSAQSLSLGTYGATLVFSNRLSGAAQTRYVQLTVADPALGVSDAAGSEGNTGSKSLVFQVNLMPPSAQTVMVTYATSNGTALAGSDYIATNGVLSFAPGQTNQAVTVQILGDANPEPNEMFFVGLSGAVNAAISRAVGTGTILNDDLLPYVYLRSMAGAPWGSTANEMAMNRAFGTNMWQDFRYETVSPATLFSPGTALIFMEGGDTDALELQSFLTNNLTLMENWVALGGRLFLNAAPNEGCGMAFGFGVTLVYSDFTTTANAADPLHPVFNGPLTPVGLAWSGNYFGHATVTGTNLTVLITNADNGRVVLGESACGNGLALFGGMTTDNFHTPQPQAANLRANILSYLVNYVAGTSCPPQIVVQPAGQAVRPGTNVTLAVACAGSPPLNYRWRKNGTNLPEGGRIAGATGAHLTISNVVEGDSGPYSVAITNAAGSVISSNATLLVTALDHFAWGAIASPQSVNVPFVVTILAQDYRDQPVTNFSGIVGLQAEGGPGDILHQDLESGLQGFTIDNSYGSSNGLWHLSTGRGFQSRHTSSHSLYYGRNEGPDGGGNYEVTNLANGGVVTSPPINLPAGPPPLTLSFNYLMEVESGTNWDQAVVEISTNNGLSYVPVLVKGNSSLSNNTAGLWFSNRVSLAPFAGATALLRFRFDTRDTVANTTEGWFLDDIVIHAGSGPSPISLSPTNTGAFSQGRWSGSLTVLNRATNVVVAADDSGGHAGSSNPFDVALGNAPPSFRLQPSDRVVAVGGTTTFQVAVDGAPPLACQWRFNGLNVNGATGNSLTLTNVQYNQAGYYSVWVTNAYGSALSSNAMLSVTLEATTVSIVPASATSVQNCIPFGANTDYGFTGLIYRNVPGFSVLPGDKLKFDLGLTNDLDVRRNIYLAQANTNPVAGGVQQNIQALGWTKIVSDSQIPANPRGNNVSGDYELAYTIEAGFSFPGGGLIIGFGGSPPGSYADSTCDQVLVSTTAGDASGHFHRRFFSHPDQDMGVLDNASSDTASLGGFIMESAPQGPTIVSQPADLTVVAGSNATFNVTVAGGMPFFYQWRREGVALCGCTNAGMCLAGVTANDAAAYSVVVSNYAGSAASTKAQLTVLLPDGGTTRTNAATIAIPSVGAAALYPSTIIVSGLSGTISKVTVTLHNVNHTYPEDLDILLVSPSGTNVMLMSDAGGGGDLIGLTLTFDDDAAGTLPDVDQIYPGTYRPTDYGTGDTLPWPAPNWPFGANLAVFNGTNPNGTWKLFVYDDTDGDAGSINGGWSLRIVVPTLYLPVLQPPQTGNGQVQLRFATVAGQLYFIEYKNALTDPVWLPLRAVAGDGTLKSIPDTNAPGPQRYYRVGTQFASQAIRPVIQQAVRTATQFRFGFITVPGRSYVVEYKNNLAESSWATLQTIPGDGTYQAVVDSTVAGPQRFYRLRLP